MKSCRCKVYLHTRRPSDSALPAQLHGLLELGAQEGRVSRVALGRELGGQMGAAAVLRVEGQTLRAHVDVSTAWLARRPRRSAVAPGYMRTSRLTMPISSLVCRSCVVRWVPNTSNIVRCCQGGAGHERSSTERGRRAATAAAGCPGPRTQRRQTGALAVHGLAAATSLRQPHCNLAPDSTSASSIPF